MPEAQKSTISTQAPVPEPRAGEVPRRRHSAVMGTVRRACSAERTLALQGRVMRP